MYSSSHKGSSISFRELLISPCKRLVAGCSDSCFHGMPIVCVCTCQICSFYTPYTSESNRAIIWLKKKQYWNIINIHKLSWAFMNSDPTTPPAPALVPPKAGMAWPRKRQANCWRPWQTSSRSQQRCTKASIWRKMLPSWMHLDAKDCFFFSQVRRWCVYKNVIISLSMLS